MVYVLDHVGRYLQDIYRYGARARKQNGWVPDPDSPLADEYEAASEAEAALLRTASSFGEQRLVLAEEHLRVLGGLIRDPTTVYAVYSVARSVAELSARAWWLFAPGNAHIRLSRLHGERLYSFRQQENLAWPEVEEPQHTRREFLDRLHERQRQVEDEAARLGIDEVRRPKGTPLMEDLFAEDDDQLGAYIYGLLSAFTHGTQHAVVALIDKRRDEAGEDVALAANMFVGQVSSDATREAHAVSMALSSYMKAMRSMLKLFGWNPGQWGVFVAYTSAGLRQATRTAHEILARQQDEG